MSHNDTSVHIEVYSDIVCPWCYVGKRRLEQALALLEPETRSYVSWRPFELNPTMPARGMDRRTYLEAKFGSLPRVESVLEQVWEAGKQSGIVFAFDRMTRVPNTFDAHRLVWLAEQHSRQEQVSRHSSTDTSRRELISVIGMRWPSSQRREVWSANVSRSV